MVAHGPERKSGVMIREAMETREMSIRELAMALKYSYEHTRNLVSGKTIPTRRMTVDLSKVLKIDLKKLEEVAKSDKIVKNFWPLPKEFTTKNPELEPIESAWDKLTEFQKETVITMVEALAKQNHEGRK